MSSVISALGWILSNGNNLLLLINCLGLLLHSKHLHTTANRMEHTMSETQPTPLPQTRPINAAPDLTEQGASAGRDAAAHQANVQGFAATLEDRVAKVESWLGAHESRLMAAERAIGQAAPGIKAVADLVPGAEPIVDPLINGLPAVISTVNDLVATLNAHFGGKVDLPAQIAPPAPPAV